MLWYTNLLIIVQVVSALAIIVLVLLQQGKGADMGAAFGSGSSGSVFGASGSSNFLSRATAVLAAIFFSTTLGLSYLGSRSLGTTGDSGGIMQNIPAEKAPASNPEVPVPGSSDTTKTSPEK